MDKNQAIIKIFQEIKPIKDIELKFLMLLEIAGSSDLSIKELIDLYSQVKQQEVLIVSISSRIKLQKEQKDKLEKSLDKEFKNRLIFDYQIDPKQSKIIDIKVNDDQAQINVDL
ncbi:hypothetical protein GF389_06265 [Candidatus Dojkabacteria bacterium]|nr:hypothetical protein [Candidatus Dojkabacteria bacterium]